MGADPWQADELELITRGRRSGREHRVRLWFAREGDVLWLRTDIEHPDWLLNLRARAEGVVRVGEHRHRVRLDAVDDRDAALRHVVTLWRAKYGNEWVQPWYFEVGREPVKLRLLD